jgi:hypothetical protein
LEDYKNISFPNIILHVLIEVFDQLQLVVIYRRRFFHNFIQSLLLSRRLNASVETLKQQLYEPDQVEEQTRDLSKKETEKRGQGERRGFGGAMSKRTGTEHEVSRSIVKDKLVL